MLNHLRNQFEQKKGKRDLIQRNIEECKSKLCSLKKEKRNVETAQVIIQKVAEQTQEELTYHISDIVSTALSAIFDEPYEFVLRFIIKRGKTEAEIKLSKDGNEVDPMSSVGGGVVDVATFALRVALWTLQNPRSRNVMVLDEPFHFLSKDLQNKASEMIKMLSDKLKLQFIIISQEEEIITSADKIIKIKNKKGISYAKYS